MIPRTGPIPRIEEDREWQQHFDDYCIDEFGGRDPVGREYDEAAAYADEMMEENHGTND